jgi:tol-pal system protein YbgF
MDAKRPLFFTPFIGLALVLSVSNGCSLGSIGKGTGQGAKASSSELSALEAEVVELRRRAAIADVEIARLERRLAELERRAGSGAVAGKGQPAPPPARDPAPEPEAGSQAARSSQPELEVSDLPEAQPAPRIPDPAGQAADSADPDSTLTAAAQALYDRGYTLYHRGQFVDSETAFQQFLSRYGATVLGDNAQFWIAEARHARGDVRGALAAYLETASRFPDGNKAPDALLKAGDCALELGDREAARESFRAVVEEFPGSAAASAARERITQLP